MLEVLQAANLKGLSNIRHGYFTRKGGVSEGIYASLDCGYADRVPEHVFENRRRAAEHLNVQGVNLLSCYQIHSPTVVTVGKAWTAAERPEADAMVTATRGIALGVLTADCGPLLFADTQNGIIGAAHAGWRGALTGVIENTVAAMEKLGARRRSIHAALGACIWQNSYEVGSDFPAPFLAENDDYKRFFRPAMKSDRYMFNLPGYIEAKLGRLKLASIESSPADTLPDAERFFSYRRTCLQGGKKTGSLISAIVLLD